MGYDCEAGQTAVFRNHRSVHEVYACSVPPLREKEPAACETARVLIAGAESYIGTNLKRYMLKHGNCSADILDTRNLRPKPQMFKGYDTVVFVAGIAHRKETKKNAHLYYEVNTNLAVRTAEAAKAARVQQFVLLSSMAVYGMEAGHITKDTVPAPKDNYGKSKLQADEAVWQLRDSQFRTAILRPPMVYGKGCRGNYRLFRRLVLAVPVIPFSDNQRSMIYIENLCAFIKNIIDRKQEGIFFPQNRQYVNTGELAEQIAAAHKKTIKKINIGNALPASLPFKTAGKLFGSLTYEDEDIAGSYGFADSVWKTEGRVRSCAGLPEMAAPVRPMHADAARAKRILAAGTDSYFAESFRCFMLRWPDACRTDILCTEEESWKESDFAGSDAVLYTGSACCRKEDGKYQDFHGAGVRRAARAASMAKRAGARMFVYLGSLHVYGKEKGIITEMTPVCPSDIYGKVQMETEKELWKLKDDSFCVAILRLPAVYGFGCGGGYREIQKYVSRHVLFPACGRKYSVLHVNNLSSALRGIIYSGKSGVYIPQDAEYASAYDIAAGIAEFHGKRIRGTKLLNPVFRFSDGRKRVQGGIFNGYVCSQSLNVPQEWLAVKSLRDGIRIAESGW